MIDFDEVVAIYLGVIHEFGGSVGIRDHQLLMSALDRPFSGFGESQFYPTPEEKAAALLESIVVNHPFSDGNKRIGYVLMRLLLMQFDKDIVATQEEKYDFVIAVATGKMKYPEILLWIRKHIANN